MNETNDAQHPGPARPLSETELRYYYFGFYRILRRYRIAILLGWTVVVVGCASVPLGWSLGRPGGVLEIGLSCATLAAGLALVSQTISGLESYVRISVPSVGNGGQHPVIDEITALMTDVDQGGWTEARTALEHLMGLESRYGLPPLS